MSKQQAFEDLKVKLQNDSSLPLYLDRIKNNYKPVPGEGDLDAKIIFIGEAPGKNEALEGRPFVGAAGKLLTDFINLAGYTREEVFITSILQDRPPGNRDPLPLEIEAYSPFIFSLLTIIKPKIIVTLGRFSMQTIFEKCGLPSQFISQVHGREFEIKTSYGKALLIPFYHPAAALYQGNLRKTLEEDFEKLKTLNAEHIYLESS